MIAQEIGKAFFVPVSGHEVRESPLRHTPPNLCELGSALEDLAAFEECATCPESGKECSDLLCKFTCGGLWRVLPKLPPLVVRVCRLFSAFRYPLGKVQGVIDGGGRGGNKTAQRIPHIVKDRRGGFRFPFLCLLVVGRRRGNGCGDVWWSYAAVVGVWLELFKDVKVFAVTVVTVVIAACST